MLAKTGTQHFDGASESWHVVGLDWSPAFAGMTMKEGRSWRSDTVARLHPRKRSQRYLYIGVTNDLARRAWEHREGLVAGFTKRYAVKRLVYIESFDRIEDAIAREKAMKKWNRLWKLDAIERANPDWDDLYELGL